MFITGYVSNNSSTHKESGSYRTLKQPKKEKTQEQIEKDIVRAQERELKKQLQKEKKDQEKTSNPESNFSGSKKRSIAYSSHPS